MILINLLIYKADIWTVLQFYQFTLIEMWQAIYGGMTF